MPLIAAAPTALVAALVWKGTVSLRKEVTVLSVGISR
jgi:hypothetical protein